MVVVMIIINSQLISCRDKRMLLLLLLFSSLYANLWCSALLLMQARTNLCALLQMHSSVDALSIKIAKSREQGRGTTRKWKWKWKVRNLSFSFRRKFSKWVMCLQSGVEQKCKRISQKKTGASKKSIQWSHLFLLLLLLVLWLKMLSKS